MGLLTTNFSFNLPTDGGDDAVWGALLNANWASIDSLLKTTNDTVALNTAKVTANTANVTAAGALMDSELTNLAAVKAIDQGLATTDSPTFANISGVNTGDEVVATETVAGIIKKATTAEAQGGVTADVYPDSIGVAAAITALATSAPKLVETRTIVGGEAALDFTGYGAYSKIQIFFKQVVISANANWQVFLSSDNGATWLGAGYSSSVRGGSFGAVTVTTNFRIQTSGASISSGICELLEFNAATETFQWAIVGSPSSSNGYGPVGANDAFRITLNTTGTFSSGTIYVYGVK